MLIVEDDPVVVDLIKISLISFSLAIDVVSDGAQVLPSIRRQRPNLVLLDLGLPTVTGLEVCRRLKSDPDLANIPVVMLTGRGTEHDRVAGLELGADDYITKPFNSRELALRVQSVLRRSSTGSGIVYSFGDVKVNLAARDVTANGERVILTAKEFDLLEALVRARGRPLTRTTLLRDVWGHEHPGELLSRTVDVHVRRLRQKLGDAGARLETLKNVGYRLVPVLALTGQWANSALLFAGSLV